MKGNKLLDSPIGESSNLLPSIVLIRHTYPPVLGGSEVEASRSPSKDSDRQVGLGYLTQTVTMAGLRFGPIATTNGWVPGVSPFGITTFN